MCVPFPLRRFPPSLLAAAFLGLAACGGAGGGGVPGPSGPTVLFSDDFSGGFPNSKWMVSRGQWSASAGPDSATADFANGLSPPCMRIEVNGGVNYSVRSNTPVPSFPITISFDMAASLTSPSGNDPDVRAEFVLASLAGEELMQFRRFGEKIAVFQNGQAIVVYDSDEAWHHYEYREDAAGDLSWSRDGVLLVTGFNPAPTPVQCFVHILAYDHFGQSTQIVPNNVTLYVDNVRITTE